MDKLYLERFEILVDDVLIGDVKGFRSTMLTPIMRWPLSRAEKQDQSRYEDNNGDNNRTKDLFWASFAF